MSVRGIPQFTKASAGKPRGLQSASDRDRQIATRVAAGESSITIAKDFGISPNSIRSIASKVHQADYDARLLKVM